MPLPASVGAMAINASTGAGLTTAVTLQVRFNGGSFAAPTNAPAHVADGFWAVALTSGEQDNDQVDVKVTHASGIPNVHSYLSRLTDKAGYGLAADQSAVTIGTVNVLGATALAAINVEADTALVDIGLDHLVAVAAGGLDVTNNSIMAQLVSKSAPADWDSYVSTTDSLQAQRDEMVTLLGGTLTANVTQIDSDAGAATKLKEGISTLVTGTVGVGSTTSVIEVSASDPAMVAAGQFQGLVLKFKDDTTTASLRGQGFSIQMNTTSTITLNGTLTTAPVSGDTYTIN